MYDTRISRIASAALILTLLYSPLAISVPASADRVCDTAATSLVHLSLTHYAAQKDLYAEGETEGEVSEGEDDSPFLSWEQYATIGGVVALAFGILWLAEEPPTPCMVATAAYGTPLSGKLTILRLFRDRILLNTAAGTAFVDVYYRLGAVAASFIVNHKWAALLVRAALLPLLALASTALLFPKGTIITGYALLLVCALIVLYWFIRARGWRTPVARHNLGRWQK